MTHAYTITTRAHNNYTRSAESVQNRKYVAEKTEGENRFPARKTGNLRTNVVIIAQQFLSFSLSLSPSLFFRFQMYFILFLFTTLSRGCPRVELMVVVCSAACEQR